MPGHIWTDEQRRKVSETMKGRRRTPEHQANLTAALKGRRMPSPAAETRARLSAFFKGRTISEETRVKISKPKFGKSWHDRFMEKVHPEPMSGCWLWTGTADQKGYGMFYVTRERGVERAHRVAYQLLVGPIPADLVLDHRCRVHACVNPAHVEPVENAENVRRGTVGETSRSKTHCPRGHAYDEANTIRRNRRRICRTCVREASAARRAR